MPLKIKKGFKLKNGMKLKTVRKFKSRSLEQRRKDLKRVKFTHLC